MAPEVRAAAAAAAAEQEGEEEEGEEEEDGSSSCYDMKADIYSFGTMWLELR
jgi:hypothetical protein